MWLHCIQESIEKTSLKRTSGRGGYNWTTFDFEGNLENGARRKKFVCKSHPMLKAYFTGEPCRLPRQLLFEGTRKTEGILSLCANVGVGNEGGVLL